MGHNTCISIGRVLCVMRRYDRARSLYKNDRPTSTVLSEGAAAASTLQGHL